jgi:nucleoside triphosphate pyrophosphatase
MSMQQYDLHLASSSPRRRAILATMGVGFSFAGVDLDETPGAGEDATDLVLRLAGSKAQATSVESLPILGADTAVVLGEHIFGKPHSEDDALMMLAALSGRTHRVLTAVAIVKGTSVDTAVSDTEVRFRDIHPDEALAYWHSGEPQGKAGSYAIQGLGGIFVEWIKGSYSGVVGMPVFETAALLRQRGISVLRETNPND